METVDVILLTKNSVYPDLEGCLRSITQNIPVNRLLAIDGRSTDGTLDILKSFNADIIHDSGNRATARQKGIELAETEWFTLSTATWSCATTGIAVQSSI